MSGAGANIQGDMTLVQSLTKANPGIISQPYLKLQTLEVEISNVRGRIGMKKSNVLIIIHRII
jgi:hypothetical protein